jgi:hypothetical protein
MNELRYTLLTDGPTDKALTPIITWLLRQHLPNLPVQSHWADLGRLPRPPRELSNRILKSIELYSCDLLFIHRDAETASLNTRSNEIKEAVDKAKCNTEVPPSIGVMPMRMTEAWLLFDIGAIREAAGNPNGTVALDVPKMSEIEDIPNPKKLLHDLLRKATELSTHRKSRFDTSAAVLRIPDCIEDFSPLRNLSSFKAFEQEIIKIIKSEHWSV